MKSPPLPASSSLPFSCAFLFLFEFRLGSQRIGSGFQALKFTKLTILTNFARFTTQRGHVLSDPQSPPPLTSSLPIFCAFFLVWLHLSWLSLTPNPSVHSIARRFSQGATPGQICLRHHFYLQHGQFRLLRNYVLPSPLLPFAVVSVRPSDESRFRPLYRYPFPLLSFRAGK